MGRRERRPRRSDDARRDAPRRRSSAPPPPPIDPRPVIEWVHELVEQEGGEVLELRVTPSRDLLLTLDRDLAPVDTDLLMRVIQALRRRIFDMDEDPGDYRIEVDTPGDRRLLKHARHFERFAGEAVRLYHEDGSRERVTLLGPDGAGARVRGEDGEERLIDPAALEAIRLAP